MHNQPIAIVGNLNVDQIVSTVMRFPRWDEELIVDTTYLELAGTAGYLALAARGLGLDPFVVSTAGDDEYAAFMRREMRRAGIADAGIETVEGVPSCLSLIFVGDNGQRGILTVLGAHEQMSVDVAERQDARVAECAEVFLCGNYLLPRFSPGDVAPYAHKLQERGQFVVFDPSWDPGGWRADTTSDTLAMLQYVDLFLPNEEELLGLTGVSTIRDAIRRIREHAPTLWLVVKRGAEGAVSSYNGDLIEVPGLQVEPINTVGAGDVFDVALLYGRRQGWDTRRCLEFACATAASVVAQSGTRSYPNEATAQAFAMAAVHDGLGSSKR